MKLMNYCKHGIMPGLISLLLLGHVQLYAEEGGSPVHKKMVAAHKTSRHEMNNPAVHADTLESLVEQLTEVQQQVELEKQNGLEEQKRLQNMLMLLEKEKAMLEKEVKKMEKDKHAGRVERIQWLADKQRLEKALSSNQLVLEHIEADLQKWQTGLPPALAKEIDSLFGRLKQAGNRSVSHRMQTVITINTKIENYQKSINFVKEVLKDSKGNPREMDVLYIGLAAGYAVAVDGKAAAVGTPGLKGWQWQWRPQLAGQIKKAMAFYSHQQIADFVQLPVKLERE